MYDNEDEGSLQRTINWQQGLSIALGVPLLILPSIGDFTRQVWGFAIAIWGLSVLQGFVQNLAYAELATMFPESSGLPGFAQSVFQIPKGEGRYRIGKFLGGFTAWGYWFAWNPVMAIFSLLIGNYLHGLIPGLGGISEFALSLISGAFIFIVLIFINRQGLSGGAKFGYVLALITILPLFFIAVSPFFTGDFNFDAVTGFWLPPEWSWSIERILIVLGLFAIAEWSACAWETAAVYAPEYKEPKTDVPKALFSCGFICLISFVLVQLSCTGTLGIQGILDARYSPMLALARKTLGNAGVYISILMLIAAMILIIQTAFLGSSRAMYSMAVEGNLPTVFRRTNRKGTPVLNMIIIAAFNMILICLRTPSAIIAASSIGYVVANGICLLAYFKARTDPELLKVARPFRAPRGWRFAALAFAFFNLPICLLGLIYLNSVQIGWISTWVGIIVLAAYLPLWIYTQAKHI